MTNLIAKVKRTFRRISIWRVFRYASETKLRVFFKAYWLWMILVESDYLHYRFHALKRGLQMNRESTPNEFNFRRNIHRLEKGLSFPESRTSFAKDYIMNTVQWLKSAEQNNQFENSTKYWGRAVLENYFQHCEHTGEIAKAYDVFQAIATPNVHPDWIPYKESERPTCPVDYDELYQLARRRRSVRCYLDVPVEAELVEKAMQIASLSPSACNRQSFKFLFFNEKKVVKQIAAVPGGIDGYEVPSIVVIVGSYRGYFNEKDVNAPVIDASLAAMAFLMALETVNLSSVCINWPSMRDKDNKIREIIDLKPDEFVIMLIGIGYSSPEGKIPFSAKRPVSDLLLVNQRVK